MTARLTILLFSTLLAGTAGAASSDKTDVVRDLAGRVGPIIGSASACPDIARPRIQAIVDKFAAVIRETRPTRLSVPTLRRRLIAVSPTAVAP
jgi:branched-chain amino acid transport system substrate-binding protein